MSIAASQRRLAALTWVQRSLLLGAVIFLGLLVVEVDGLRQRLLRDVALFVVGPVTLAATYGRNLGWRVDRRALRNTVVLAAFVLPFYVVGSSLPTIRSFYPMWGLDSAAPAAFLPHAAKQVMVVVAAETYYRGFLCVGIREIGFKSVFVSPVVYAVAHATKPPIELLLSGPTDVLFGAVDYRSASLLPSVVAHGAGLVLLDWLVLHDPLLSSELVLRWLSWLPIPL